MWERESMVMIGRKQKATCDKFRLCWDWNCCCKDSSFIQKCVSIGSINWLLLSKKIKYLSHIYLLTITKRSSKFCVKTKVKWVLPNLNKNIFEIVEQMKSLWIVTYLILVWLASWEHILETTMCWWKNSSQNWGGEV